MIYVVTTATRRAVAEAARRLRVTVEVAASRRGVLLLAFSNEDYGPAVELSAEPEVNGTVFSSCIDADAMLHHRAEHDELQWTGPSWGRFGPWR